MSAGFSLRTIAVVATAAVFSATADAQTIALDLELLQDAAGNAMPVTGLVVFTAAQSGVFYGPTPTSFANGDDLVTSNASFLLDGGSNPAAAGR